MYLRSAALEEGDAAKHAQASVVDAASSGRARGCQLPRRRLLVPGAARIVRLLVPRVLRIVRLLVPRTALEAASLGSRPVRPQQVRQVQSVLHRAYRRAARP